MNNCFSCILWQIRSDHSYITDMKECRLADRCDLLIHIKIMIKYETNMPCTPRWLHNFIPHSDRIQKWYLFMLWMDSQKFGFTFIQLKEIRTHLILCSSNTLFNGRLCQLKTSLHDPGTEMINGAVYHQHTCDKTYCIVEEDCQ